MEVLHLPDNLKVHFAACESMNEMSAILGLGVQYGLYTSYAFVEKMVFGKNTAPIKPMKWMNNPSVEIPKFLCDNMRHVIQDSGLFTLMFGKHAGKKNESLVNKWYDNLIEFTLNHGQPVTCVEVDCQKVLGADHAWDFRYRMRNDLPNNRIINVFHLEDGQYGLDRMIEFSDYIAISVPELRLANKKEYVPILAKYIKERKPTIDIHLLGCTEIGLLKKCRFCTSSDSTSWTSPKRFGFIEDYHVGDIIESRVRSFFGEKLHNEISVRNPKSVNTLCLSIEYVKRKYESLIGNQDYYEKNG